MKIEKLKVIAIIIVILVLIAFLFLVVSHSLYNKQEKNFNVNDIDISDVNNVNVVDKRLTNNMSITQAYLLSYTINKSGTWYKSNGYVQEIKYKQDFVIIKVSNSKESDEYITLEIEKNKCNVKKGNKVYFAGTTDLETYVLNLAKISTEDFVYSSVIEIEFDALIKNINLLQDIYFLIYGYVVKVNEEWRIYNNKNDYENNNEEKKYFVIETSEDLRNASQIKCKINGTFKLKECSFEK